MDQQVSIDEVFKVIGEQQMQLRMAQSRIMVLEQQLAKVTKEKEETEKILMGKGKGKKVK
jgi:hypothetical protein